MLSQYCLRSALRLPVTGVRNLAAAATASHVPPKKIHGITGRYAGAVYTAASKAGLLDKVEGELKAFHDVMSKSSNLQTFLNNPSISRGMKEKQLDTILDEKKFSHVTRNLLMVLAANGRARDTGKVINAFNEIMQAARGAVDVTIISAETLKKKQLDTITKGIMGMVEQGKSVNLTNKVDPSILGGLQVMIGDKFLDLSVSSRVIALSSTLDAKM